MCILWWGDYLGQDAPSVIMAQTMGAEGYVLPWSCKYIQVLGRVNCGAPQHYVFE